MSYVLNADSVILDTLDILYEPYVLDITDEFFPSDISSHCFSANHNDTLQADILWIITI